MGYMAWPHHNKPPMATEWHKLLKNILSQEVGQQEWYIFSKWKLVDKIDVYLLVAWESLTKSWRKHRQQDWGIP
jgi:hypothetical protein